MSLKRVLIIIGDKIETCIIVQKISHALQLIIYNTMITQLVGEHFITTADEQSPRWVNCDVSRRPETTVTNAAKELSTSSEHGDWITISYIDNVIAVNT